MEQLHRELTLDIYDTVADQGRWPAVLDRVAGTIGAHGCIVFEVEGQGAERSVAAPYCSASTDRILLDRYIGACSAGELADQDIFEAYSNANDEIQLIDDSVLAENDQELRRKPHVKLLRRFGTGHRAASLLSKDNPNRGRFSVQLTIDRGRLTDQERASASVLMPHVAKAIELGRPTKRLAEDKQALIQAMDGLRVGICLLDEKGRVAHQNREFQRQREENPAFRQTPGGGLELVDDNGQKVLREMHADVALHGRFGGRPRKEAIVTSIDERPSALCIELTPLQYSDEIGTARFGGSILYSFDTSQPVEADTAVVGRVFGLTESEMLLTGMIAEGLTNRQIAERRYRSQETINAQVKSVLSKTQCSNRTQLVRLLSTYGMEFRRGEGS